MGLSQTFPFGGLWRIVMMMSKLVFRRDVQVPMCLLVTRTQAMGAYKWRSRLELVGALGFLNPLDLNVRLFACSSQANSQDYIAFWLLCPASDQVQNVASLSQPSNPVGNLLLRASGQETRLIKTSSSQSASASDAGP
jgi:hypothetical protein